MKENISNQKGKIMTYLIMKCEELGDQWECDASRIPITLTKDWKKWVEEHNPDYRYEVYQCDDEGDFMLIKNYDTPIEKGMALYYWDMSDNCEEVPPHIVVKFPMHTRHLPVPEIVKDEMSKVDDQEEVENWLTNCGHITWYNENKYYVYGEYEDNFYTLGY
jgi:hypothetical protein